MSKKKIKIRESEKLIKIIELDKDTKLSNIRNIIENEIKFDFIFLNEDEEEIKKEEESVKTLDDILDGKNLYLKKVIIKRTMLGEKVETKNGLDFYVIPQEELTYAEDQRSINILVIGETGVGKSTWLHCFLNYLQGIQIEEKNRYYLFDEKKLQEEYIRINLGEQKSSGSSVKDKPAIYNIKPTKVSKDPIRLIDTAGFGNTRGENYDKKITYDIKELFTNKIDYLHAVCLIFKATETRAHDRAKQILDKLFLLFEKGIKDNIIIIFTFVDDFDDVQNLTAFKTLNDKISPFRNILGPIENLPHFEFNNLAYLTNKVKQFSFVFDKCQTNFDKLLKYVSNLKPISLKNTVKVLENRTIISYYIKNVCIDFQNLAILMKNRDLLKTKEKISKLDEAINETLKESLLKLKEIASKENQLNKIALKWYENYGFSKKILDEYFHEIKNRNIEYLNKIKEVFNNTFSRIDSISSNEDIIKEMKDELFKKY